jgi:hypothetical protein
MPTILQNHITKAEPLVDSRSVRLTWANGAETVRDFRPVIREGGVFATLDEPGRFAEVRIVDGGRAIEWPGEIDFGADSLWFEDHPEDNPFSIRDAAQ